MDYIITWNNGIGRVGTATYLFDILTKPSINFDFDSLYYETGTKLFIKVVGNKQYDLTSLEKQLCEDYCKAFTESDEYNVIAIDEELKVFKGVMTRGEAKKNKYSILTTTILPEHPMSKWDGNQWRRIVAAIDQDGWLTLMPPEDSDKYAFLMTEREWNAHTKPAYNDQVFDFKTQEWKDIRGLEDSKKHAEERVRAIYLKSFREFNLVYYEIDPVIYMFQLHELDSNITPFFTAMSKKMNISVDDCKERVKAHYSEEYLTKLGNLHGEMYSIIDKIRSSNTLDELDSIMMPLCETTNYPWRREARLRLDASLQ